MRRCTALPHVLTAMALGSLASAQAPKDLDAQDVVWDTPSIDAAGSMPIGNGEVTLNAWVEAKTGDLLFLIGRTDTLSEISRMLKVGRVRVSFSPSPFLGKDFRQHLRLRDGRIELRGRGEALNLWVDAAEHVVHVAGNLKTPRRVTATVECWRNAPRPLAANENGSAWSVHDAPFPRVESADVFPRTQDAAVTWYHRNETSVVPKLWANQSLTGLPGAFDPLLHLTFGGRLCGPGLARKSERVLESAGPVKRVEIQVATCAKQTPTARAWVEAVRRVGSRSPVAKAESRTRAWWNAFWGRSWVFVSGDLPSAAVPLNDHPLRMGVDSGGGNVFPGEIERWRAYSDPRTPADVQGPPVGDVPLTFERGFTLAATINTSGKAPGRIFDKVTPGGADGFLFDTHPGTDLRLIVGSMELIAPKCLTPGKDHDVVASYDGTTGEAAIYLDGKRVAHRMPEKDSMVTRGYVLQRYVQACQGRGKYPMKFNGGTYTVEPTAMGIESNPDYRNWGDPHWFQNVRHMTHPMIASGDFEMTDPFFRLYESVVPLAQSRTKAYHGAQGVYFPETMTVYGTYSGGDYGWDRSGLQPKDVMCPYWQYAWNQGPELVALMLDRWDYTRDETFLKKRVLPMATEVLRYFDTRFAKDAAGKIVIDPTQVVETYWKGVVNDLPTVSGLIAITDRLVALPTRLTTPAQRASFARLRKACPELPLEPGETGRELAPAQKYNPERSNVENGELYAVWPFRVVSLAHPALLEEAKRAYAHRGSRLDTGWGYDANVAALLGMTDEAARILNVKVRNSHPKYRWPATWGPNFDWLPDQNHGGNLLNTTNLMLLQSEPIEAGGAIRVLPAWPKTWDVDFLLHAPGKTTVRCVVRKGKIERLEVTPASRRKDVTLPAGWSVG